MLKFIASRSGRLTLTVNEISFHSQYDPHKEAERFIDRSFGSEIPSVTILIGAGLGYILEAVERKVPDSRLLAVYYSHEIYQRSWKKDIQSWYPGCGFDVLSFLRNAIHEDELEGLKILEWPPARETFPDISQQTNSCMKQVFNELAGSLRTSTAFGKLWITNTFINYLAMDKMVTGNPARASYPIIIAAAGPSLNRSIEIVAEYRDRINLWALPSALPLLNEMTLIPDLVVLTDPGFYAIYHLLHARSDDVLTVAMPLSASRGIWRIAARVFILSQHMHFEQVVLNKASIPAPLILPHGTVAASALELATKCTEREIVFAGLDLCYDDIRSHAKPNIFDALLLNSGTRLKSHHSSTFTRALQFAPETDKNIHPRYRTSLPLDTYSGWFEALSATVRRRVFRLCSSHRSVSGFNKIEESDFSDLLLNYKPHFSRIDFNEIECGNFSTRRCLVKGILQNWLDNIEDVSKHIERVQSLNWFTEDTDLLQLFHFIDPVNLVDTRRNMRMQTRGNKDAFASAHRLLNSSRHFICTLQKKIDGMDSLRHES